MRFVYSVHWLTGTLNKIDLPYSWSTGDIYSDGFLSTEAVMVFSFVSFSEQCEMTYVSFESSSLNIKV